MNVTLELVLALISAGGAIAAAIISSRALAKAGAIQVSLNGRLGEMLRLTAEAAEAKGRLDSAATKIAASDAIIATAAAAASLVTAAAEAAAKVAASASAAAAAAAAASTGPKP